MKAFLFIRRSFSVVGLLAALSLSCFNYLSAQIICIYCYNQNDSISSGVNNLLLNGSFENNNCIPNTNASTFCPNSFYYSCGISDWTCSGGGASTYASMWDNTITVVQDGNEAVYFGNYFCHGCSNQQNDTSCLVNLGCTVTGIPSGYPINDIAYGGTTGVTLQQTVSGLIIGNTYVLEFWTGGEDFGSFLNNGLFAVDVGFGDTLLRCRPTDPGDIGRVYIIEFNATAPSHTIKFTNWGHICDNCTELILDNVRLYTLAELSAVVPACSGASSSSNSFAASDTDICEKFCINFYDSSQNNPTAWQWNFPGGSPSSSSDQNPLNICYNTPGLYDVTLVTTGASGNDTLTLSNYITVYSTPPFPTITQVGYTLTSSAANSYQWQFNSYNIPGATNQSYTVLQTGYYTVIVGDSNSCQNSFTVYVLISGINDVMNDANVSIYPNPSNGNFTIELHKETGDVSIDVVNPFGQIIFSSAEKISSPVFRKEIDLRNDAMHCVSTGVYFIEITTKDISLRKKIVVE